MAETLIGVPTEPHKAFRSVSKKGDDPDPTVDVEAASAIYAAKHTSLPVQVADSPKATKEGRPTDTKRGGVTKKDLNAEGAFALAKDAKPPEQPSITGNDGVITEPKRGNVNTLEQKLEGVAPKASTKKATKAKQ